MPEDTDGELRLFAPESLRSRLMDDEDLVREVLQACLPDLERNAGLLRAQLAAGDCAEACRTVHSMKGSAQNTELRALAALAKEIEDALKTGDGAFARAREGELVAVLGSSIQAIEGYFSEGR